MGSFKHTILTQKAHALMAKLTVGAATSVFTKVKTSNHDYSDLTSNQLEALTTLEDIKQEVSVSEVKRINDASSVKVTATVVNTGLKEGYYIKAIGLYAQDPDEGEILYSVTVAIESDWMPPFNNITSASALYELVTTVSNAENVSIEVDPNATVSITTFNEFKENVNGQLSKMEQNKAEKTDLDITNTNVAVQSARIDAFTKLAEGSTTGDAELIDSRVGIYGNIYDTSGNCSRNEIKSLKDLLGYAHGLKNSISFTDNYYINKRGEEIEHNYKIYSITNYIDITLFAGKSIKFVVEQDSAVCMAMYDENKTFLKYYDYYYGGEFTAIVPSNAVYARFTVKTKNKISFNVYYKSAIEQFVENDKRFTIIEKKINDISGDVSNPLSVIQGTPGFTKIFRKIGVIGDSLSSGEFEYRVDGRVNYIDVFDYSWGQFIARATGNKVYNFSKGGMDTSNLQNSNEFAECLKNENKCQAYFIALGTNDRRWFPLGSNSDIDLTNHNNNAYSFYGYYAKTIQKLQQFNPKAKIFLVNLPKTTSSEEEDGYNKAIRYMETIFDNIYLIDLFNYAPVFDAEYKSKYYTGGHGNALGYEYYSRMIMTYVDYIIKHNFSEFKQVQFITEDKEF